MSKNPLFNFINVYQNPPKNNFSFVSATNKKQVPYFRIQTPCLDNQFEASYGFSLVEHHISVYNNENIKNTKISQYHYTAYFNDSEGAIYRLHVYFNHDDELTTRPCFEKKNSQTGKFEPYASKIENEVFINLAYTVTMPVISELRKAMMLEISNLQKNYETAEQSVAILAEKLPEQYTPYANALKKMELQLKKLDPLVHHSYYAKILSFISKLKMNVEKLVSEAKKPVKTSKQIKSAPAVPISESHAVFFKPHKKHTPKVNPDEKEINYLLNHIKNLDTLTYEEQTNTLVTATQQVNALSLVIESLPLQTKLSNLFSLINQQGKLLLELFIEKREFILAKKLKPFHHYMKQSLVIDALKKMDHELLDFAIYATDFAVNTQLIKINQKKNALTAMHYCFKNPERTQKLSDCLGVLIQHGGSILLPEENGLPLVLELINNADHIFYSALCKNEEKTIQSIPFYKRLITKINLYLKSNELSEEKQKSLNDIISYCALFLNFLSMNSRVHYNSKILEATCDSLTNALTTDPDIFKYVEELRIILSPANDGKKEFKGIRTLSESSTPESFEFYRKWIKQANSSDFETVKAFFIQSFQDILYSMSIKRNLIEYKKEFNIHSKEGRRHVKEKMQELEQYNQKLAWMSDDGKEELKTDASKQGFFSTKIENNNNNGMCQNSFSPKLP